ncbi:MAG: CDP-alcohol phosphatidyltransferase family protein [Myxococcales bacterium]|nr:CDP-alcohol phosphatidyltransferase family protein [Myxococcales bacterium]
MSSVVEIYQRTKKVPDLFWNRFVCRPIAAVVVKLLERTPVTPNQVTLAAFGVACIATAVLLLWPGYWGLLVGVVIYEASYVLDCADGMLARLRGIASKQGHLLDFLMDEIKAFMILGAVGVRLYLEAKQPLFLLLTVAGLVVLATGIAVTTFQRRPEIAGEPAAAPAGPPKPKSMLQRLIALPMGVAKLLVHYPSYIWLAGAVGRIDFYFYPYLVVNALYAAKSIAWLGFRFGRFRAD